METEMETEMEAETLSDTSDSTLEEATAEEKADATKAYLENRYSRLRSASTERQSRKLALQSQMTRLSLPTAEQQRLLQFHALQESAYMRMQRQKLTLQDFELLTLIGRGAFGEVRLCRQRDTGINYAMKRLCKRDIVYRGHASHAQAEHDMMAQAAHGNPWLVKLHCSFQDDEHLCLVMEYLAGGDMYNLLARKECLTVEETRFYIAETLLAIASVHELGYMHRDIKPDNLLLDKNGHIKLADFGLVRRSQQGNALAMSKRAKTSSGEGGRWSIVGSPDYMAPEILLEQGHSYCCDWWSLGVVMFEMLFGYPPFYSEDSLTTCRKILSCETSLIIPDTPAMPGPAVELIRSLLQPAQQRFGSLGVSQLQAHPFFSGVEWRNLHLSTAPYVPKLSHELDTSHFEPYMEESNWDCSHNSPSHRPKSHDLPFLGYHYRSFPDGPLSQPQHCPTVTTTRHMPMVF